MKERIVLCDQARRLLVGASTCANRLGQTWTTAAHVLMCVTKQPPSLAEYILNDVGIDVDELRQVLKTVLLESEAARLPSEGVAAISERAQLEAERLKKRFVGTEHVLISALRLSGPAVRLAFERLGVPLEVALARAEAIAQDVANRKVLPKRKSGSALHQLAVRQITALDAISPYRRWLIGFGALISAVPAAFFGVAFILARSQNVAIRILKGLGLGTGLLCVAAFMLLVWVRLWFGRRMWIDAALSALLGATYVYLFIGVWALLSFVCVKLCTL